MRATYSQDLRLCVLRALDRGQSKMSVHRQFGVSRPTLDRWLAQRAALGHVRPQVAVRRGQAPALGDLVAFAAFARRHHEATLRQMAAAWQHETGVQLSDSTFSVALKRLGWTRKKRAFSTPNGRPRGARISTSN